MSAAGGGVTSTKVWWWLSALTVVLFGFGVHGHLERGNGLSDAIFKSLQLFHLHYHPDPDHPVVAEAAASAEQPAGEGQTAPPAAAAHGSGLSLEIARFGAGLIALAWLPALLGLLFRGHVARWWLRTRRSNHIVVLGNGPRPLGLVRDLRRDRRTGPRVVFISRGPVDSSQLPGGVLHFEAEHPDRALLERVGVTRAAMLVALNDSDRDNLEVLVAAQGASSARAAAEPLDCYAHFGDTNLQGGLYQTLATTPPGPSDRTRSHLFNYYDYAARLLARKVALPAPVVSAAPLPQHFVIIGFGTFGQCVALKLVKMGQQLYRESGEWKVSSPKITVVDPRGAAAVAAFLGSRPEIEEYCTLDVVPLSCDDPDFISLRFLQPAANGVGASVVFCLDDESTTVKTLLFLLHACRGSRATVERIYLRIAEPDGIEPVIRRAESKAGGPTVVLFAADKELFTQDVLLNRSLDVLAREVHQSYLPVAAGDRRGENLPPAGGTPWEQLSEDDRESNREVADHMWAKLAALGYRLDVVPAGVVQPDLDQQLVSELKTREEELARVEHFRWVAWRVLNGWKWGSPRDNDRRLHPDLLDYDKLPATAKAKARIVIQSIPTLLKKGRLFVQRA